MWEVTEGIGLLFIARSPAPPAPACWISLPLFFDKRPTPKSKVWISNAIRCLQQLCRVVGRWTDRRRHRHMLGSSPIQLPNDYRGEPLVGKCPQQ